jgi:hypothetical protein
MRIASWIPKATNPHSKYVILIAFPLQQWLHERTLNVTLNVYCMVLVSSFFFPLNSSLFSKNLPQFMYEVAEFGIILSLTGIYKKTCVIKVLGLQHIRGIRCWRKVCELAVLCSDVII